MTPTTQLNQAGADFAQNLPEVNRPDAQPNPNPDSTVATAITAQIPHYVNTIQETAGVLKISTKSVRRLIDRNLLSASKGLRHIRITRKAIEDYLANTSKT